jgi:microcin C transport system permease protein
MVKRPRKNPLASKRWSRFRRRRAPLASLIALSCLFAVSLVAELVCNDRPLLMRYEGEWMVPFLRFYPEDRFTGSGRFTRTDFKQLEASDRFQSGSGNWMLWAPVPYGPNEIIDPATLRSEEKVALTLTPSPRVASLNVDGDGRILRSVAADFFFPGGAEGKTLSDLWQVPDSLMEAVQTRLRNQPADELEVLMHPLSGSEQAVMVSMTQYRPRSRGPRSARITLREQVGEQRESQTILVYRDGRVVPEDEQFWEGIPEELRSGLLATARARFLAAVYPEPVEIDGQAWSIQTVLNDVQFPFPPIRGHWMGIDAAGRDVFARILYGMRIAVLFGISLVVATMALGTLLGGVQGYYGGALDLIGQRVVEIWSTLPFLYVMILLGSVYGRSFGLLLFCYALFNWIGISMYMRAEFLRLRRRSFVEAAKCLGIPAPTIMLRHILPNAMIPLITFCLSCWSGRSGL